MEGGAPVVKGIPWIILAILFYNPCIFLGD
jgi:hypothetical protein